MSVGGVLVRTRSLAKPYGSASSPSDSSLFQRPRPEKRRVADVVNARVRCGGARLSPDPSIGPGTGLLLSRECLSHDTTYFPTSARTFESML